MSEELKPFDKLLDSWKQAEGFTVWADDHAGVLRNLSAYATKHSAPAPDHTELVKQLVEALDRIEKQLCDGMNRHCWNEAYRIASGALTAAKQSGF